MKDFRNDIDNYFGVRFFLIPRARNTGTCCRSFRKAVFAGVLAAIALACSPSPADRVARISDLARQPGDRETAKLRTYLADPDAAVRSAALEALVAKRVPDAGTLALQGLSDTDPAARAAAAACFAELRDPAAVGELERLLREDGARDVRRQAARALHAIGGTPAVQALVGALLDPASEVRLEAAEAVGEIDPGSAIDALSRLAAGDPDWTIRVESARALGRGDRPEAYAPLREAIRDPNEFVRASASAALRELVRKGVPEPEQVPVETVPQGPMPPR
jgi:HEAT repeat protein